MAGMLLPMVGLDSSTHLDWELANRPGGVGDPDHTRSCIWYWSSPGKDAAERIAGQIQRFGHALIYPTDQVLILASERHQFLRVAA